MVLGWTLYGDFEWDAHKASANFSKHGVRFEEVMEAMADSFSIDLEDSLEPDEMVTLASHPDGRIFYVVWTTVDDRIRIISAREATRQEGRF